MDYDQRTYLRVVMLPDGGGARVVSSQARNGSVQAPQFALVETRSAGNLLVFHFVSIQLLRITVSARLADVAALRSCQQEKQTKAAESSYPVAWRIRLESPLSPPRAMERRHRKNKRQGPDGSMDCIPGPKAVDSDVAALGHPSRIHGRPATISPSSFAAGGQTSLWFAPLDYSSGRGSGGG